MSWPVAKLGEVAPAKPLKTVNIAPGEMVWHLNLDKIESNSGKIIEEIIVPASDAKNSTHWFDSRHVLYSKLRPYLNKVVVPEKIGVATTELIPMAPDPKRLDRTYLAYYLKSPQFVHWISGQVAGAKMPRVSMKIFWSHEILLPPLPEQKRIAAILDKADAIRRKRRAAIKLADDFLHATFLNMFGDPVTNPKGWEVIPLGKLCRIRRGASPRPIAKFLGGNVPWIKIGDGTQNSDIYIEDTKDKIIEEGVGKSVYLDPGSLIFANCGVSLGFARIITMGGCIHDGWLSFDQLDQRLNEMYLLKLLNSVTNYFRKTAPDGTQPNLNTSIMKNFSIPIPPKKMQDKFSSIVMKFQQNKQKITDSEKVAASLFNSLTQRAFRGEL